MKRICAVILAAFMMCSLFSAAVWADEIEDIYPEEGIAAENEYVPREPLPLYSDEIGDYHSYEDGAVKAYVRLNQDAVTAVVDGELSVYDKDGNYVHLDPEFSVSAHPWIQEMIDEYVQQHLVYDENGLVIEVPDIGIPGYNPYHANLSDNVEMEQTPVEALDVSYGDREEDSYSIPQEGSDGNGGTASNPNTGVAVAVTPAILAALALVFKKR